MKRESPEPVTRADGKIEELRNWIDSLESGDSGIRTGSLYLKLYELLARANRVDEAEKALFDAVASFKKAGEQESFTEYSLALYRLGMLFRNKGSHTMAQWYFQKAYDGYMKAGDAEKACSVLNDTAINMEMKGEIREALLTYRRGLTSARQNGYEQLQMKFVYNTSVLFSRHPSLHREALRYNEEAAFLCRKLGDFRGLGYVLNNAAFLNDQAGNRELAKKNAREALLLREEHGTHYEKGFASLNLAGYLDLEEELEEREDLYLRAREIMHETRYFEKEAQCLVALAEIKVAKEDLLRAKEYLESAREVLSGIEGSAGSKRSLLEAEYHFEKARGNWDRALSALEQLEEARDEVSREGVSRELKALCGKWDVDLINMEDTLLQAREYELAELNGKLDHALQRVKRLASLIPVCSVCGERRNDGKYMKDLEEFASTHFLRSKSSGLCNRCRIDVEPQAEEKGLRNGNE